MRRSDPAPGHPRTPLIDAILTAAVLGFLAGAVPGPYTTVVASTALERGFRAALPLAFVPLLTDVPPMVATALVLDRLDYRLLTLVGVAGGVVLAGIGVRFYRRQQEERPGRDDSTGRTFWAVVSAGLLSPAPWIFWLVAASPLLLRAWNRSWVEGVAFATTLFALLIGTATALAWLASHGRGRMRPAWRRKVIRALGIVLVVAGGVLVWQSITGNFQSMIDRQEELRDRLDEGVTPTS